MTEVLPPEAVPRAAALLRAGRLVAFPTETVYGLGADATAATAVASVYAAKGRPQRNPLIAHYPTAAAAFEDAAADTRAWTLAARFWPGPLTLVLPRAPSCRVVPMVSAGRDTLAVRVPAHPVAQALLAATGRPVAAPSANRSGRVSPTSVAHVLEELGGRIGAVLDGGDCAVGVESTVLDLTGPVPMLLRPGHVSAAAIEAAIGPLQTGSAVHHGTGALPAPGMLASHYAPRLPVRLLATAVGADEALLAFGPPLPGAGLLYQLSDARDLHAAAARLFAGLRWLDREGGTRGLSRIAAMPVPELALGVAINDRLARAAAPR